MATAKVFRLGDSQAARFGSDEVEIFRRGDEVVLRETPRSLAPAFDLLSELPIDADRHDPPEEAREGL